VGSLTVRRLRDPTCWSGEDYGRYDKLPRDLNALTVMVRSREAETARLRQIGTALQGRSGSRAETLPNERT